MTNIGVTHLSTFCECPRKWQNHDIKKLRKKPDTDDQMIGTVTHDYIRRVIEAGTTEDAQVIESWPPSYTPVGEDFVDRLIAAKTTFDGLFARGEIPAMTKLETQIETKVEEANGTITLRGVIDALDADDRLWEWKTTGNLRELDLTFDIQLPTYIYILRAMGLKINECRMLRISSKAFARPELLKPTKKDPIAMSMKKIHTTWAEYSKWLRVSGLDPAAYADMQDKLAGTRFHLMLEQNYTDDFIDRFEHNVLLPIIGRIISCEDFAPMTPNPWGCSRCDYKPLCEAELYGLDVDLDEFKTIGAEAEEKGEVDADL